ncbi:MAG TPA: N-acyl-D-aspartate/D-glutamate deacylase [Microscillaceae bacterium]|nr:N-acyl-D-aspartate/D-glutamate deacylase [Microscillaceae bacterium]
MANIKIIRNGLFFDGTGAPGKKTDVVIKDGKVDQIGPASAIEGAQEIEAEGCWVTPGFLDIHTHYDAEVEVMPGLEESVRHGVTTVVFGNCSLSSAVGTQDDILNLFSRVENMPMDILQEWIDNKITWKTTAEYYEHLDKLPVGPNISSFIGHSNIRIAVMGLNRSLTVAKANQEEIKGMQRIVDEAMEAGYLGLSIDMLPFHRMAKGEFKGVSVPSQQAHPREYKQLAKVVRQYNRVLQATPNAMDRTSVIHLLGMTSGWFRKPLKTTVVAALDTKSDQKVHWLATTIAAFTNSVLRGNMKWQALAEPFLNFADGPITPVLEEFPSAVQAIGATVEERKAMFADPKFRAWFRKDWEAKGEAVFHRNLDDMWILKSPEADQIGKSIEQIAKEVGKEPIEMFMDLIASYDQDFRWKSEVANHRPKQRLRLLASKQTIPGFNDSGAHNVNMAFQDGALQMLKQVQANPEVIPLEKAIYRLTKLPAEWLGLKAGTLNVGDRADAVVIDPSKLQTNLSAPIEDYDERLGGAYRMVKRSDGVVKNVLVGGEEVFTEGKFAKDLGNRKYGKLLRSTHR